MLNDKTGKLYLGFFLDPLYEVHWNNRAEPIRFQVEAPDGVHIEPSTGQGPRVDTDADTDPREFLLDVVVRQADAVRQPGLRGAKPVLKLTVTYFACDNAETFCVPVTQQYAIHLQADPDGGSRRGASTGRSAAANDAAPKPRPSAAPPMLDRIMRRDVDGDGKISREEALERMLPMFDRMDANSDGKLDRDELQLWMRRMRGRESAGNRPPVDR